MAARTAIVDKNFEIRSLSVNLSIKKLWAQRRQPATPKNNQICFCQMFKSRTTTTNYMQLCVAWWLSGRALDLRFTGRGFNCQPVPASAGGKDGIHTSVGWQVTLCDPIWHVSFP